jgi:hypothetical protein
MSDLLRYAALELQRIRAESAAKQFEAEQKQAADLRSKAVSALRQFLPQDRVWEIEPLGPVTIGESYGEGWHRGLELTADGLIFGYAELRFGFKSETQDQLFLRHICKDCGGPIWVRLNKIADLAQKPGPCPACKRKNQEQEVLDPGSLAAHLKSVQDWHSQHGHGQWPNDPQQTFLMIAYERWINGRPLLKDER